LNNYHDQRRLKTMTDLMTTADLNNDHDRRRLTTMTGLMTPADMATTTIPDLDGWQ
jgi:hypothetical protein